MSPISTAVDAQHLSQAESMVEGRAMRALTPRRDLAEYIPSERDPVALLAEQNADRVPELVPLRMGRMLASPFAFYRGTAGLMAADLARCATSEIEVISCGDAHISNFGLFASPQRNLVFDLNDFDEAGPAPFEWDVKRLVTSVIIGARDAGFGEPEVREAATQAALNYRRVLTGMMRLTVLERYYFRADTDQIRAGLGRSGQRMLDRAAKQARKRTSEAFADKVTETLPDGRLRIIENPPLLQHLDSERGGVVADLFAQYVQSVPADIAVLLAQFTLADVAMRVVGVGSVGTRCFVLLLTGPQGERLVLQIKEAPPSVLETWGGRDAHRLPTPARGPEFADNEGFRVVASQRILQAVSDSFLGYFRADNGRDFYVRQFRDRKGSIDIEGLSVGDFGTYANGCAALLARAHAQSASAPAVVGYLGSGDNADRAIVEWSFAYAEQSLADFTALQAAVAAGRVEATAG
ncbi:DUF2252 domain-containing protein [Microterricola pindariensis]|uniref:DUF2252 domain-containing protein n=1 Tax=Microterricola pindariensis TaxID=478010 RepID=A0ABX5AXF5_9MICO|nr:DUF2252 domain-containing protein [Microterricola pindariensis]PPL19608.1 hypothetical protein GY24_05325 [Microterricola pindariensis]